MNKPKIFRALACALFATAFVSVGAIATPAVVAYAADATPVTDDMASDGLITLGNGDYVVNADLHNAIKITGGCTLTFNNDAKLEISDNTHDAIQVYTSDSVTITDANVVQKAAMKALRVDRGSNTTLDNCEFSAVGLYQCLDVEKGTLTINGGTYQTLAGTSVVALIRSNSNLTINGGTFITPEGVSCIGKEGGNTPSINGGSFSSSSLDVVSYIDFDKISKVFSKNTTTGLWDLVDDDDDASADASYVVKLNNRVVAYAANEADAKAFADKVGGEAAAITFEVGFELDGGYSASGNPDEYDDQTVSKAGYAKKPADPYKEGFKFVKWVVGEDDAAEAFDFEHEQILKNLELRAVYTAVAGDFTITYDANGGTFSDGSTKTQTYKYAARTEELDVEPTRSGKYFVGWTLNGSEYEFGNPITENVTLKAQWADPVAECDGVGYATLQDAFNAAEDGSTVKLLADVTLVPEHGVGAVCINIDNLTFDLNMHTITYELGEDESTGLAVLFLGCDGLKVKNGSFDLKNSYGIILGECEGYELSELDIEVKAGEGDSVCVRQSTGKILSGWYSVSDEDSYALNVYGGTTEIKGGAFFGAEDEESGEYSYSVCAPYNTSLTVTGGDFCGTIETEPENMVITGGTFENINNIESLADGYVLLQREVDNGRYRVVKVGDDGIPADAYWSATFTVSDDDGDHEYVIYYEDGQDAQDFKTYFEDRTGIEVTVARLRYKVSFMSRGYVVETRGIRLGESVGELPAGEEVSGWTFSGWYDGDILVDASFAPADDVTLVAKWVKNGSGDESDDPDDKGDDSDKGGSDEQGDKDGKSDKAMPQTGDTINAVLPVCVAFAGALVCAFGLVFRAHKRK